MPNPLKLTVALAAVAALTIGGASIAAGGATEIKVERVATHMPGDKSPVSVPGVRAIRRGKEIPSGYRLIGQRVTNRRGSPSAGAALYFRCPGHKRLRSFAGTGRALGAIDRRYVGHRSTWVRSAPGKRGEEVSGIAYAVCR